MSAEVKRSGTGHHCHALQCRTPCKPEFLMCPRHWRMVPGVWQSRVYASYRPGQCDDMEVSLKWVAAAKGAIRAVAEKEGVSPDLIESDAKHWDEFAKAVKAT